MEAEGFFKREQEPDNKEGDVGFNATLCARESAAKAAPGGYFLNWKLAVCMMPSFSKTWNWRQLPAQDLSVFQT